MTQRDFEGKAVVVTGGASGIGAATAALFAERGASVVVADIADGSSTVDQIESAGGSAIYVSTDVARENDIKAMVDATVDHYGGLHAAFNAAGVVGDITKTENLAPQEWERVLAINLSGTFLCLRHQIPAIVRSGGGAIVNTASAVGLVGIAEQPAYVASKFGIVGLSKVAALDYAGQNVRVNALCPGFVNTPILQGWIGGDAERAALAEVAQPIGRTAQPVEIAEAAVWMCSPAASFMTGTAISVDGGYTTG